MDSSSRGLPLVRTTTRGVAGSPSPAPSSREMRPADSQQAESVLASLLAMGVSYAVLFLAWRLSRSALSAWDDLTRRSERSTALRFLEARHGGRSPSLSEHERSLAQCVVDPQNLGCGLRDVGGLDDVVEEIRDLVVLPLARPELFASGGKLVRAPRGVLLYGPPGCGKTMLARAVANDAGAALLDVRASTLSDKYYGETNKLVRAVFTLASKLAPCVVFLDEVDGFLAARSSRDADVTLALKAEFMSSLDGLLTDKANRGVVVLAATNRPYALDSAVLRRFARQFKVSLPDVRARRRILALLLAHSALDDDVDLDNLAHVTANYSGADLEEVCRAAATRPIRELARSAQFTSQSRRTSPPKAKANNNKHRFDDHNGLIHGVVLGNNNNNNNNNNNGNGNNNIPRPVSADDFRDALRRVAPTGADALSYRLDTAVVSEVD